MAPRTRRGGRAPSRWTPALLAALVAVPVVAAACGESPDATPAPAAAGPTQAAAPPVTPSPTAVAYSGTQIVLGNQDSGRTVSVPVGADILVHVRVPLSDDCGTSHLCVVSSVDDATGILVHSQELTTCDKDGCTFQREDFVDRAGSATLRLGTFQPCPYWASARCTPQSGPMLWSVRLTVG